MNNIRDQIISFLLQASDSQARVIEDLQKQLTELKKAQTDAAASTTPAA